MISCRDIIESATLLRESWILPLVFLFLLIYYNTRFFNDSWMNNFSIFRVSFFFSSFWNLVLPLCAALRYQSMLHISIKSECGCFRYHDQIILWPTPNNIPELRIVKFIIMLHVTPVFDWEICVSVRRITIYEFSFGFHRLIHLIRKLHTGLSNEWCGALQTIHHFFAEILLFTTKVFLRVGSEIPTSKTHTETNKLVCIRARSFFCFQVLLLTDRCRIFELSRLHFLPQFYQVWVVIIGDETSCRTL